MTTERQQFIVDDNGERVGVILSLEEYRELLAQLEELESIRAYDAAKASDSERIPLKQALAEIDQES